MKVSSINPRQGIVTDWKVVKPFHTDKVRELVQQNVQHGVEFCFIKCGDILQVLVFPPVVKENSNTDPQGRLNFNIIVVDSNSRPHFYRMLPKSVAALRAIVYDESIPATALDFEMFQAISQHTFDNIRPLFSGIVKGKDILALNSSSSSRSSSSSSGGGGSGGGSSSSGSSSSITAAAAAAAVVVLRRRRRRRQRRRQQQQQQRQQ